MDARIPRHERHIGSELGVAGSPGFTTRGLDLGRGWAVVGIGGTLERSSCLSIFANYDAQLNNRTALHVGTAGVRWVW